MGEAAIVVEKLHKTFAVEKTRTGSIIKRFKQYCAPQYDKIMAIEDLSFSVKAGERVAFIGPNGAGKSTTIKILTGILHGTSGSVSVLGKNPSINRAQLAYEIGAIFGQRSQLWYHLPTHQSLTLLAAIYDLPVGSYETYLDSLLQKFEVKHLINKPVRQLSLGERMRCEIVASLLHRPKVLFLDEPTIGLDVTAKAIIRDLLRQQSILEGTTILLTSHDTGDIEAVCDRVIIINHGKLVLDDTVINLKRKYIRKKMVRIITEEEKIIWDCFGTTIIEQLPYSLHIEVDLEKMQMEKVLNKALALCTVKDLTVEDPPLESVIQSLYQYGLV